MIFFPINPGLISSALKVFSLLGIRPISQEQVLRFEENKNIDLAGFEANFNFRPRTVEQGVRDLVKVMKANNCL